MNDEARQRLERVVRRLPIVGEPTLLRHDSDYGEVFMGYGLGPDDRYFGAWGVALGDRSLGRLYTSDPGASEKTVQHEMFADACFIAKHAEKRHITEPGWWDSGQVGN